MAHCLRPRRKAKIAASGGNPHNSRINITMHNDEMPSIVETAVEVFNRKQLQTDSIGETFRKVDQDPWKDSSADAAHFDKLEKNSMYKTNVNVYPTALDRDEV